MKKITAIAGNVGARLRDRSRCVKLRVLDIARAARAKGPQSQERLKQGYGRLGSARPVVSTMIASNLPFRFISPSMMRIRSPRTVQQMQPLFISNTSSSAPMTSSLSMPISPCDGLCLPARERFARHALRQGAAQSRARARHARRRRHPPTPKARRANIQLWNPHPVTLVMYRRVHAPNARRYEMAIHRLLKPYRVHGKWFSAPLPVIRKAAEVAARQSLTPTAMEKFSALCAKHPGRDHPVSTVKAVTVATLPFRSSGR